MGHRRQGVVSITGAFLFVFLIIAFIFIFIGVSLQNQKSRELEQVFHAIARKYDGQCALGGFLGRPSVHFVHHGAHALLDIFSTGGKHPVLFTQLHLAWPDRALRFEVFPEGFFSSLGKLMGTQDIIIGSPAFDRDYIIRGNDAGRIVEILTPAVQRSILALYRFLGNNDIYVGAKAGTILVKKRSLISDVRNLERFMALSLELYDEMLASDSEGIEFIGSQDSTFSLDIENAVCQICGESVKEDLVLCRSCRTPHHQDCWLYYGKCSTYGCGETRFERCRRQM